MILFIFFLNSQTFHISIRQNAVIETIFEKIKFFIYVDVFTKFSWFYKKILQYL